MSLHFTFVKGKKRLQRNLASFSSFNGKFGSLFTSCPHTPHTLNFTILSQAPPTFKPAVVHTHTHTYSMEVKHRKTIWKKTKFRGPKDGCDMRVECQAFEQKPPNTLE